ncbi:MAG: transposase domain-containing protein [Bacillota bacterium]
MAEVAELIGASERTVRRMIVAGKLRYKTEEGRGRGGKVYLVAFNSLPPEAQRKYLEDLAGQAEGKAETPPPSPAPAEKITTVAELVAKYGQEKAEKILDEARQKWEKYMLQAIAIMDGPEKDKLGRLKALARARKVSPETLYRKVDDYRKLGLLGLVHKKYLTPGEGLDGKMRRTVSLDVRNFIRAEILRYPRPKASHVYKKLKRVAPEKGWTVPSKATFYRVIEEILHTEKVLGQRGEAAYDSECLPKVKRDYTHLRAMEEIVGDGHTFDLFVEWQGRAVRPQLSAWEDMRSRKIVGWCIAPQANSETIALALRHAIRTHGLPGTIYTDWGKDYLSNYIKDFCQRMEIAIRNCIPKTPRSKMIESLFKTVHDEFTIHQPGYCGNKPENRPPGFDEKKLLKQKKLLTMEEFVTRWAAFVEWYNNRMHGEIGDTPINVFASVEHIRPGAVPDQLLDVLMMKKERVKVNDGYITLLGREYWSHNVDLGLLVGEWVQVWYDFNRMGEVLIWYKGKCIGTAVNREALLHGQDRAKLAEELKAARAVKKALKQRIASYVDGIEDVVDEEVVKKARRVKRYYSGNEDAPAADAKVQRLTGQERLVREAADMLKQSEISQETKKRSRSQDLYLKWGNRVLAK